MIQNIKGQDTAARYGGEEFAIILPNTSVGDAAAVAENIRKAISSCRLRKKGPDAELGLITVSMGVGSYVHGEALKELIERTDKALYEAKKFGRNRVMSKKGTALQKAG